MRKQDFLKLEKSKDKKQLSSLLIGGIFGISVFIIILVSILFKIQVNTKEKQLVAIREFSNLRFETENIFSKRLTLAKGLLAYVKVNPEITTEQFAKFSEALIEGDELIRNISMLKGTIISFVYPYEENKSALGTDLLKIESQRHSILQVIESREPIITGIINLVQGGKGIIFRIPVFIGENYWGQASVVINADLLFETLRIRELEDKYKISIERVFENNFNTQLIYGDHEVFINREIEMDIHFGNATWKIGVVLKKTNVFEEYKIVLVFAFSLFFSVIIGSIAGYMHHMKNIMKYLAYTDALTKLPNRLSLEDVFMKSKIEADRTATTLAIIIMDINKFKYINDTYGHITGDKVLKKFSKEVSDLCNKKDILLRMGGDEFLLILHDVESQEYIESKINEIHKLSEKSWKLMDQVVEVTTSIGYSLYPQNGLVLDTLIHEADQMMYENKRESKKAR